MKHSCLPYLASGAILMCLASLANASEPQGEGKTKAKELRPLSTDRPDITESPVTVDKGHFQVELDAARYSQDAGQSSVSFANTNLKVGVTDFWDMQLVIESLIGIEEPGGYNFGFGDLAVRSKFNFIGNDSGNIQFGVMPWVKVPTAGSRGNGSVEGGLIGLLGVDLPADFSSGFMVEGDMMQDSTGNGYHFELLTTATLGHPIWGPLGGYIELFGTHSTEAGAQYALGVDGGFTYLVTDRFQLDAGVAGGLTTAAEDLSVFCGASFKL